MKELGILLQAQGMQYSWVFTLLFWVGVIYLWQKYKKGKSTKDEVFTYEGLKKRKYPHLFALETTKGRFLEFDPAAGVLVLGSAGAGKTASFVRPVIDQMVAKQMPGVIYDHKAEFAGYISEFNSGSVENVFINLKDIECSHRLNILSGIEKETQAHVFASTLLKNMTGGKGSSEGFWDSTSENIIAAYTWFLKEKGLLTLPHLFSLLTYEDQFKAMDIVNTNSTSNEMLAAVNSAAGSDNTIGSINANARTYLGKLGTPEMFWIFSGANIDLAANKPEANKRFIISNDTDAVVAFKPIIAATIRMIVSKMSVHGRDKSLLLLDEAAQFMIPNFSDIPATTREFGISTIVAFQNLAQYEDMYGKTQAQAIIGTLSNQFLGLATNNEDREFISKKFGQYDKRFESETKAKSTPSFAQGSLIPTFSSNKSTSYSYQQRPRADIKAIAELEPGEFYAETRIGKAQWSKLQFKPVLSNSRPAEVIQPVTREELVANKNRIKKEIRDLVERQ